MSPTATRPKCILVVEDDFVTTELLSQLRGAGGGYRVGTADDGAEALARGHYKERPDLILLDLRMPRMDGFDFLKQRQANTVLASIPVVIGTAAGGVDGDVIALSAAECLHKPLDPVTLLPTVRRLCG